MDPRPPQTDQPELRRAVIHDGGQAFPTPIPHYATSEDTGGQLGHPGMSLRDYLAAHAPRRVPAWAAKKIACPPAPQEPRRPAPTLPKVIEKSYAMWVQDHAGATFTQFMDMAQDGPGSELMKISNQIDSDWEAYRAAYAAWREAQILHQLTCDELVHRHWRWIYADSLLMGRSVTPDWSIAHRTADTAFLVKLLRDLEWAGTEEDEDGINVSACPWCGEPGGMGHTAECRLRIALGAKAGGAA